MYMSASGGASLPFTAFRADCFSRPWLLRCALLYTPRQQEGRRKQVSSLTAVRGPECTECRAFFLLFLSWWVCDAYSETPPGRARKYWKVLLASLRANRGGAALLLCPGYLAVFAAVFTVRRGGGQLNKKIIIMIKEALMSDGGSHLLWRKKCCTRLLRRKEGLSGVWDWRER